MSGAAFLRIKKLKGGGIITAAARHNKREIQAEMGATGSIDPTRSHMNYALAGPAAAGDVAQLAKDTMTAAGVIKLRKDAVMGLEIVFSLPPGHAIDDRAYFTDCATWAGRYFEGVTLTVDVHKDEAQDHCHLLLLPLVDGRMAGSDMLGGKQMLSAMHKQFHLEVAGRYELSKATARLTGESKKAAAKAVLQRLRDTGDKALQSSLWAAMRDVIESDPMRFVMALSIELKAPAKKLKTFTQIMTSKGKGKAKEANPIGFTALEKRQTLCSVGFTPKAAPAPATKAPLSAPTPPPDQHFGGVDQPLTDIPNADGEVAAPTRPAPAPLPLPAPAWPIERDETLAAPPPLTRAFRPTPLPTSTPPQCEAPFVEMTTRHRDCDQSPDRYDSVTGDFIPTKPPAPRLLRQAADGWVIAALATRSRTPDARRH